jgi:hypothetical protein
VLVLAAERGPAAARDWSDSGAARAATNCVGTPGLVPPPQCRPDDGQTRACRLDGEQDAVGYRCEPFVNACPGYVMEAERDGYDRFQAALPRHTVDGTRFPRTDRLQYRGIRDSMDQFTIEKVLRAIGGDPTPNIGGRLHWQIAAVLRDPEKLRPKNSLLDRLGRAYRWHVRGEPSLFASLERDFAAHGILDHVRRLIACRLSYDERAAAIYASDLTTKALRHLEAKWSNAFPRHLFAYNTEEFRSYGDFKGGIHLYSTTYPLMAHAYGGKILVFANQAGRTLDLNYWNFVHGGGIWGYHYADRAEFVTANVIDPRSVRGMWKTDEAGRDEMGRDDTMPERRISFALMQLRRDGVGYGVILDPVDAGCILRVGAHFETCSDRIPPGWEEKSIRNVAEVEFGALTGDGRRVPVRAVVRACDVNDDACDIPDAIFAEMPLSDRGLTERERQAIRGAAFSRGRRLFAQKVRFPPGVAAGASTSTPPEGHAHAAR